MEGRCIVIAFTGAGGEVRVVPKGAVGPDLLLSLSRGSAARLNGRCSALGLATVMLAAQRGAARLFIYRLACRVGALTIAEVVKREPVAPANNGDGRATEAPTASAGPLAACHERVGGGPGHSFFGSRDEWRAGRSRDGVRLRPSCITFRGLSFYTRGRAALRRSPPASASAVHGRVAPILLPVSKSDTYQ